jgi:4-amino-4-deoxy-L-arabinose transferase-like glycosyltransferase
MIRRDPRSVLAILLGMAFVARLAAVLWLSDTVPYSDFVLYHAAGQEIAHDLWFLFRPDSLAAVALASWWPPVYPLFLGVVYGLLGVDYRIAVFVQVILGTLTVWFVYRIAQSMGSERGARIAAGLVAVVPTYVFVTNQIASENLFVFLLAWGVDAALRTRSLTRAAGVVVPGVLALWFLFGAGSRRAGALAAGALILGAVTPMLPWTIRNAVVAGSLQPVSYGGGVNFYFGHNPEHVGFRPLRETPLRDLRRPPEVDARGYALGIEHIRSDPSAAVRRTGTKLRRFFGSPYWALHVNSGILLPDVRTHPDREPEARARAERQKARDRVLHGPLRMLAWTHYLFVCVGAAASIVLWRRLPGPMRLLAVLTVAWILIHLVYWAMPRYRFPVEMFLSILTAWALSMGIRGQTGSSAR